MKAQRWTVGDYTLTSVVEDEIPRIAPELFFPGVKPEQVLRHGWVVPEFADASGRVIRRVQAFVIEGRGRCVLVDPCVGNGKKRALPFWNEKNGPFLERLAEAGYPTERVDTVVHTHLHADHVGWDTRLDGSAWVPTFTRARHLYTERDLHFVRTDSHPSSAGVYDDSIAPIFAAGLADVVDENADLGGGLRLESTRGHTPGHVSLWLESRGETAIVSGDFLHHPVQCAETSWPEVGDVDPDEARATRRRMLERAARTGALFVGTHFATRPAGRVVSDGDAFRFVPAD
jgi:glyoxylase-like metal-dependent hydrolase (beta-lactamase superfamily II)